MVSIRHAGPSRLCISQIAWPARTQTKERNGGNGAPSRGLHLTYTRRQDHYQTLSIPHNATKSQIKSSFYKLSKLYHPDVATGSSAKETFQRVSEAYSVLGDERKRRAYDRSLKEGGMSAHRQAAPASAYPGAQAHGHWTVYESRRRPGATHAWDHAHRPRHGPHQHPPPNAGPYWQGHSRSSPFTHPQAGPEHHRDPFDTHAPATGHNPNRARQGGAFSEADRMNRVSSFWRAMQVIGVIVFVAGVGGGFR